MKTVSEVANELNVSAVTINKYKNKTLREQLTPHFFKEFRAGKEVSVIDDEGIEIIRKRKETANIASEDDDNISVTDNGGNEQFASDNDDYLDSDSKAIQTLISSYQQQINSLQQQLTAKDKQITALSEQLSAAYDEVKAQNESNRQNTDKMNMLVDNQQHLIAAILRSPRLKIDTAYLTFEQPGQQSAEYASLLAEPEKKKGFFNKIFNK